ncbi:hypothetical protein FBU30_010381 [Linnemannia zychae]|nr:hypothetical protein FBU30_010381 [Linnemannia zychae]
MPGNAPAINCQNFTHLTSSQKFGAKEFKEQPSVVYALCNLRKGKDIIYELYFFMYLELQVYKTSEHLKELSILLVEKLHLPADC